MKSRLWKRTFSLRVFLLAFSFMTVIAAILVTSRYRVWRMSRITECRCNLAQLGNYLMLYSSQYGNQGVYPTDVDLKKGADARPANVAFWSPLWEVPDRQRAVAPRPGGDELFVCPLARIPVSPTALTYTSPQFAAKWPAGHAPAVGEPIFPGGRLSDAVRRDVLISGDVIGPPDRPNHGGMPGQPSEPVSALTWAGERVLLEPGSERLKLYQRMTTGGLVR